MKGVILAGGTGSRLSPITDVTNKHLLPVGRKPMILHLVEKLVEAHVTDIMVITGTEHMGDIVGLLGSGKKLGCSFTFKVQDEPLGIAHALLLSQGFVGKNSVVVTLGDNMFEDSLVPYLGKYKAEKKSCFLILKEVDDPERYGVAVIEDGLIVDAVEKPADRISDMCITGIYIYDSTVFDKIKKLKISKRGEYEITEVNKLYIDEKNVGHAVMTGWWTDAGTFSSYFKANNLMYQDSVID